MIRPSPPPAYLDPVGVAKLLQVPERTVRYLAQRGEIPAFRVGRVWRFSAEAIRVWAERRSSGAA